jgi:hypothetical protein
MEHLAVWAVTKTDRLYQTKKPVYRDDRLLNTYHIGFVSKWDIAMYGWLTKDTINFETVGWNGAPP